MDVADDVVAVIVDYHADQVLVECVDSLLDNDVESIVVVENGEVGSVPPSLLEPGIVLVSPGVNLGYGRGVNRGVAAARRSKAIASGTQSIVMTLMQTDGVAATAAPQSFALVAGTPGCTSGGGNLTRAAVRERRRRRADLDRDAAR